MRRILLGLIAAAILAGAPPAIAQGTAPAVSAEMAAVLEHPRRAEDRARDVHRNPAETLAFLQVEPGMTVVDYMPAGGWFTRVLVPYLGSEGTYVALNPAVPAEATGFMAGMRDTAGRFPAQAREWTGGEGARVLGANTDDDLAPLAGTADRVLIFREMHNLRRSGWAHESLLAVRRLLKPDGLLGIEQHRAKADSPAEYALGEHGYLREADVVAFMQSYGFELVDSSEVNANPADPADWEEGVWTLPPGYRGTPETDTARRTELDAIGESDRMTLLFRKRA